MPLMRWAHVAIVLYPDHTAKVYIDGKSGTIINGLTPKQGPVWVSIGWHSNLGGQYWKGRLAHVAVYPKALSTHRIQEHYRRGMSAKDECQK